MTIFDFLHERIERHAGLLSPPKPKYNFEALQRSEWSNTFERLMRNRLLMGALRYGLLGAPNKPSYNRISSIRKRLDLYEASHNDEHLVDIANLCLCEFVEGKHKNKHIKSNDDHNYHCQSY